MLFALAVAFTPSARAAETGIRTPPPTAGSHIDSAARGAVHGHGATGLLADAVGDPRVDPRGARGRGRLAQRAGAQSLAAAPRLRGLGDQSPRACTADAITLEGGMSDTEGNVLICHENTLGPVCDDFWSPNDAGVACRQLGYPTGSLTQLSFFGEPSSPHYWLDDLRCNGTEASLSACDHGGWGNHNCGPDEAAGVVCTTVLTGLSATGGKGLVRLAWDRPPWDEGITRHEYRYKTTGDYPSAWTAIPNSAASERNDAGYTVRGLAGETQHTIQVRIVGGGNASDPGEATATTAANSAPRITTSSPLQVAENTITVATLAATDDDRDDITWTRAGGADAAQFAVTSAGELSFAAAPNYEDPADVASSAPANAAANNEYLVTVRASDGTESTDLPLVVQVTDASEQPAKPDRPAVSPTAGSTTSLDVSWTAPDPSGGPDIIGYEVQYQEAEDGAWNDWTHDGTGTSTAITGLTASTEYQARVRALNGETPSDWSDASDAARTSGPANSAPTFPPDPLTRRVAENSPAGAAVGDPVTATDTDAGDTLSYTLEGEDASSFDIGAATGQITTRAEVSYDHEASPSYSVTVKADDGNGGAASVAVAIDVTDVDEQPAKPDRPAVSPTAGSTTSLDVSWTAPDLDGGPDIIGYELQYREAEDGAWNDWTHDGTGTSTAITGLTPGTEYQARVRALNGETPSDWSDASDAARTNTPPSPPANSAPRFSGAARTRSVPENSEAGADVGDPVTAADADGDTLSYSLEGEDASSFSIVSSSGQIRTAAEVDYDHEAARNAYSVTVRASDGAASDTVAVTVDVTDVDEQPAKPDRPAVSPTAGSTTSLDVSWTAPDLDGGPDIIGYELQYREAEDGAWNDWTHDGTGTSTAITGLTASTEYQARVRALNGETPSDWSDASDAARTSGPANSAPTFPPDPLTRRVAENSPAGAAVGDPVTATDTDAGDTLSYTLEGEDASSFDIGAATGQITTRAEVSYDHEASPSYSVTVKADDGNGGAASVAVAIDVTDVDEQPATPDRPAVSPTAGSTTSLDVSWTAPDLDGGPDIIGYELQYREAEDGAWNDWTHDGTGTSTAITGLTASTEYQARVRALNGETPSDWSDASDAARTSGPANSAPTFPPDPLTRRVAENSPAGAAVGDPVTATDTDAGDTLSYTLEGEDASSFDIGAATGQITTRAEVSYDHEASPSYSVTVKADDGNGGAASVAVAIDVTDVDEQPARPDRPAVSPTAGSTTGLDVSWTAPDLDGGPDIVGYEVQYRPSTVTTWTDWPHGGGATSTSITGLTASTEYQVRVRALNGETPSDWSEPAIAVTATPVPALGGLGLVVAALLLGGLRAGLHRRRRSALAGHPGGSVSTS